MPGPHTAPAIRPDPTAARASALRALGSTTFDVLVVGGGITGAGIARDAALRGWRTALVEREDFASGTSSRSSRLIHGGLRYLEHGQLRLVFESSRERRILMRTARHLVRPLAFTWPVYRGARVARWTLWAGLMLYDLLALFRNASRHRRLGAAAVRALEPQLDSAQLLGGARYWDAGTDDARLTLATVLGARDAGAVAVNHMPVVSLMVEDGRVVGAHARDAVTGETVAVRARIVVNAAGPWSDDVERMADPGATSSVRGSKGVHVSVPRRRVGNVHAITLLGPHDGRVMFVLPAGDLTIIGTTDGYVTTAPEEVRATSADVRYLLHAANHYFPASALTEADVVAAWAGIRPLAGAVADDPGAASREHVIEERVPGLLRVTGGKLTTFRAMAQEVMDRAERTLGTPQARASTHRVALRGSPASVTREMEDAMKACGDAAIAERLVHAHGTAWRAVWRLVEADASLGERVDPSRPYVLAELRHAVEQELARTLGDLLIRRVPLAFEVRDHGVAAARRMAPRVGEWLAWDGDATVRAFRDYEAESSRIFRIERADDAARTS